MLASLPGGRQLALFHGIVVVPCSHLPCSFFSNLKSPLVLKKLQRADRHGMAGTAAVDKENVCRQTSLFRALLEQRIL